ncbi:DMT family transporter [Carnobacterium sp. ISL-102]|uniref:DMT family transporter n=1 Tax=Carnobacterium sp. ISL-102 TaxID=2819142 RepID=UPI001BEBF54E|nr:DMT family transporter [Carnobacterium sp. ISL-102]MBT2732055.1 DMT family transporter [Carnobacterium sp. ISL-102]
MTYGLLAGFFWGLDTVILGIALFMSPFLSTEQAILLAPFISTFIHDFCSSLWMLCYMGIKKESRKILAALKTRSGKVIVLAALMGGPIGMTGYVLSISYIGAAYTAIISALFPGVGALLSYIFLKEKMKGYQIAGLTASILGVIALGYSPGGNESTNMLLGFFFALMCVIGWSSEAVIIAYGLKTQEISDSLALQIRQLTSAIFYGAIIIPVVGGWSFTLSILSTKTAAIILLAALFGTTSYLFYYKAINKIGASKAMALNITYSAWSIVFGAIILNEEVSLRSVIFALIIVGGSVTAATDLEEIVKFKKKAII